MSDTVFRFNNDQRFRVISGNVSFYATARELRYGIGDFNKFNAAASLALATLEEAHASKLATGIGGRWEGIDVQLDVSH